jgi:hypothetical protein
VTLTVKQDVTIMPIFHSEEIGVNGISSQALNEFLLGFIKFVAKILEEK